MARRSPWMIGTGLVLCLGLHSAFGFGAVGFNIKNTTGAGIPKNPEWRVYFKRSDQQTWSGPSPSSAVSNPIPPGNNYHTYNVSGYSPGTQWNWKLEDVNGTLLRAETITSTVGTSQGWEDVIIEIDASGNGSAASHYRWQGTVQNNTPYRQWYLISYGDQQFWMPVDAYGTGNIDITHDTAQTVNVFNVDCNGCYPEAPPLISASMGVQGGSNPAIQQWTQTPTQNVVTNLNPNVPNSPTTNAINAGYQQSGAVILQLQADEERRHQDELAQLELLRQIRNNQTNQVGGDSGITGYSNSMMGKLTGTGSTNWGEAFGKASNTLSNVKGLADNMASRYAPPTVGNGAAGDWTMSFCGKIIDLDPLHQFPQAASVSWYGWAAVCVILFGRHMVKLFWQAIRMFGSQQLGGVPNMEVYGSVLGNGVGGNAVGVALAVLVPVVFLLGWAVVLGAGFVLMYNSMPIENYWSDFAGGMGGKALYLLTSFFPLQLALTLGFTALVLNFTVGGLMSIAAGASRILFGK